VPFISASLYKLPLMAHIYTLIERGELHLSDTVLLQEVFWAEGEDGYYDWSWVGMTTTVEEALFAVGAYSSNVAAWALATLTTWPEVEATARAIGMVDTYMYVSPYALPNWPPVPGNGDSPEAHVTAVTFIDTMAAAWGPVMLTTPRDIATFFSGLLAGRVVSVRASWAMIDILSRQAITDRFPQLLPEQAWLAHKTGNLDQVIHDAGIIYAGAGPVIVVGMVEATVDEWSAITTLQHLALAVYQAYQT
jgi:beta-lactamase class A